ncbi:MAG: hypothetical protein ACP5IZ_11295 [Thermoprotei archaeon]
MKKIIIIILIILILLLPNPVFASITISNPNDAVDVGMVGDVTLPMLILTNSTLGNITIYAPPNPPYIFTQLNVDLITFRDNEHPYDLWIQNVILMGFTNNSVGIRPINNIWNASGNDLGPYVYGKGTYGRREIPPHVLFYVYEDAPFIFANVTYPFSVLVWLDVDYENKGLDLVRNMTFYIAHIHFYVSVVDDGKTLHTIDYDDVEYWYFSKNDTLPPPTFNMNLGGFVLTGRNGMAPLWFFKDVNVSLGFYYKDFDGAYRLVPYAYYYGTGTYERVWNVTAYVGDDYLMHVVSSHIFNDRPTGFRPNGVLRYVGNDTLFYHASPFGDWRLYIVSGNVSLTGYPYPSTSSLSGPFADFWREWSYRVEIRDSLERAVRVLRLRGGEGYISFHDLPPGNYTVVLALMVNNLPYPVGQVTYYDNIGRNVWSYLYGFSTRLYVRIPVKHVTVVSNTPIPIRFTGLMRNFTGFSNNTFTFEDIGSFSFPLNVSNVWFLKRILVNGSVFREFEENTIGQFILPVDFGLRRAEIRLVYERFYKVCFSIYGSINTSDNFFISMPGLRTFCELWKKGTLTINGSVTMDPTMRLTLIDVTVNGKKTHVNDLFSQEPNNFTLIINNDTNVRAYYIFQALVNFHVFDASGKSMSVESIIVNGTNVGMSAYLPLDNITISSVTVNGEVYKVNLTVNVRETRDVQIYLPKTTSSNFWDILNAITNALNTLISLPLIIALVPLIIIAGIISLIIIYYGLKKTIVSNRG